MTETDNLGEAEGAGGVPVVAIEEDGDVDVDEIGRVKGPAGWRVEVVEGDRGTGCQTNQDLRGDGAAKERGNNSLVRDTVRDDLTSGKMKGYSSD
jgi:hypothetical protein